VTREAPAMRYISESVGNNEGIQKRASRKLSRLVTGMYGPPHDCKGKLRGEKTSLRKCIRPLMEISSPGHDKLRACLSL
jgi:hypothetical protein